MTPRSRKPVMLAIFGNSDPKSNQNNISELLEESGEVQTDQEPAVSPATQSSGEKSDMSSANDNGLPAVVSNSSSTTESLSSAFM